ncbi:MAG TPA: hypothetical protein VD846_09925 [Allosphingosinicella sp.]|nr:hypothetical protein [Allosphingosinicella sp.]
MILRRGALFAAALAVLAGPASAQLVPGLSPPASPAEAIDDAHSVLCTLAAAGRPMPGLNMKPIGGEGFTPLDRLPKALEPFFQSGPAEKIVQLKSPGDPVWLIHDPRSGACAIISFTDPAPAVARLLKSLDQPGSWKRRSELGKDIDHAYEWKVDSLTLLTEIAFPDSPGPPLVVIVTRGKS